MDGGGTEQERRAGTAASARLARRLGPWLVALASLMLYLPSLGFELVSFDDLKYLPRNPHLKDGLSLHSLAWAFRSDYFSNWHPLTWVSYLVDLRLFGPGPAGHHLTNALLHALNAGLLAAGLSRVTGRPGPSLLAAALFALHPLRVESVAWVSQRKDVLSLALGLLATGAYLAWARRGGGVWRAALLLLFAAGLMAKPVLVTLPILLLLLDVWPLERGRPAAAGGAGPCPWAARVREKLPLFALSLISGAITLAVQRGARAATPDEEIPLSLRLANALYSLGRYLAKSVWPDGLSVYYLHPFAPGGEAPGAAGLLGAGVAVAAASLLAWRFRATGYAPVGWLWFCVALLPNLGLVQVGMQGMADRYTYLASLGSCTALAFAAADLRRHWRLPGAAGIAAAACVLAALAVQSARQLQVWRSSETLFRNAVAVEPGNWLARYDLAQVLLEQRRDAEASVQLRAAVERGPHLRDAWYALGLAESRQGHFAAAIEAFRRAVEIEPAHLKSQRGLARLLYQEGRLAEAVVHWEAAARAGPNNQKVQLELGLALLESGEPRRGREALERALERALAISDGATAQAARRALARGAEPAPEPGGGDPGRASSPQPWAQGGR